jgi:DNA-binding NarL/FixJ family response regulator
VESITSLSGAPPAARSAPGRPRIVLADDHPAIVELLTTFLSDHFEVVGLAADGDGALELCRRLQPDLLILDVVMPERGGIEVLRELRSVSAATRVLVFSSMDGGDAVYEAMASGAYGYISKTTPCSGILDALHKIVDGQVVLGANASKTLHDWVTRRGRCATLNQVELEVFRAVALGMPVKEIAARHAISESGAYRIIGRVREKIGAKSEQELTLMAVRRGLIPL